MGTNYHSAYTTSTLFKPTSMNPPLAGLDKISTYQHNAIIHSDGSITYTSGTGVLDWSGMLRILFNREDGQAIENTVATGNITLADNEMAYVDLNETDGTALTVAKAAITTASASNFLAFNRLVFGYRNTSSNNYFPVSLFLSTTAGSDTDAIHDNVASEISAITEKAVPVANDLILIEDSAAANVKKKVLAKNLPALKSDVQMVIVEFSTNVTTGDGQFYFHISKKINGMDLVDVHAEVITAGTTGTTDIQIRNVTDAVDMLTTKITIDSGETGSDTAATPAVIDTANDDVAENDLLRIDIDAVQSTPPKGLIITLGFKTP